VTPAIVTQKSGASNVDQSPDQRSLTPRQALLGVPGDLAPRVRESVKPVSITQRWLRADTVRVTFESAIGD
jgi:hypothetical protein